MAGWKGSWLLGGLGALALTAAAYATVYQTDGWSGKLTRTEVAFEALRFTVADPAIQVSCANRFAQDNDLVDMGAEIHQAVAGGWEVHVNLNFEPVGPAPRLGDIEALVFVNTAKVAQNFISIEDPSPTDDPDPAGPALVDDAQEYVAAKGALNDATVRSYANIRFNANIWMWDEDVVLFSDNGASKTYDVTLTFKKPDGGNPPKGKRNIIARVTVLNDLSLYVVESVTSQ